jgi:predicted transposase YbfD/YdcC
VLDCVIAGGRRVPDGRLISGLANDLAGGPLAALGPVSANRGDLLGLLAGVSDGRPGQGRDHPVAAVLALAAAAVVAGSRSFTAITGWAADVPASVLEDLYRRCGAARPGAGPPSKATIWRVVTGADPAALDAVTGSWLMERAAAAGDLAVTGHRGDDQAPLIPVRVDGKTVRGARNPDGTQVHLLAALAGQQGVVAAQTEVGAKTNEIPMIIPLLDGVDLHRAVVTADALHCQRATADYLHRRGADFILPAKDNQPGLFDALDALPWHHAPVTHAATDRGHGRIETRTIQVLPAPGLPFPHVSQAYLIERHVTALDGQPLSDVAALGVTSLDATRASPRGHRRTRPRPVGDRVPALAARHPLPRRPLHRPHPLRAAGHGHPQKPRRQRPPPGRTARHHRSHPLGQPQHGPALHHPRTHFAILKQPVPVAGTSGRRILARIRTSHELRAPLIAGTHSAEIPPRLREAEPPVRAAANPVGVVIVLPVVLPEADRADLIAAALAQRHKATARTGVRPVLGLALCIHKRSHHGDIMAGLHSESERITPQASLSSLLTILKRPWRCCTDAC